MNRYQFEDLISSYLENELSFSKRKEFENYMRNHPGSENLVRQIDTNIFRFKNMPKLKVRSSFNQSLEKKVEKIKIDPKPRENTNLIFGFTPLNASFLFCLIAATTFISIQLTRNNSGHQEVNKSSLVEKQLEDRTSLPKSIDNFNQPNFSDKEVDSINSDLQRQQKKDYSNKIQFVND